MGLFISYSALGWGRGKEEEVEEEERAVRDMGWMEGEEEERRMRKRGGWEHRGGKEERRKRDGEQGEDERTGGQNRCVCGQLGAQRPGGESMGRRRPLRGRAVHWATFPLKLAPCFSHEKKRLRLIPLTRREPPPETPPITEAEQVKHCYKIFSFRQP